MTRNANHEQHRIWNGADGRHWAEHHQRYDAMAAGQTDALLDAAAITDTHRVLDIGCGTGQTTRSAARRARRGYALGVDLSEPMLERARRTAAAEGLGNAEFAQGDAQVHPFPPGGFDAAVSRAGVMFFADPVAAFGNIGRALRSGGRLAFVCHRNPGAEVEAVFAALAEHLPSAQPAQGVTDFTDPDHIRTVLDRAGFTETAVTATEVLSTVGTDPDDAADFLLAGQAGAAPGGTDTDRDAATRARHAVAAALRRFEGGGAVRIPARGWLVTARAAR
ncbi:class I SAM-dependent methyltransferase [Nocardiopsis dassonvillei]|uniref:class I SAM-dependent methyltransferase n=1 Tax=Nocardiopsis dassonvillei TaxID=2014 RepID=UPI00200FFF32|nr:class I SAM-dependent methyltransferase [Nocardiopsis dassonvillei]MCK9868515.1 class I SAM-dependent methyltransferase [Nocardiopsis dassonvillei]